MKAATLKKFGKLLLALALLPSASAFARPKVILIGGIGSTASQMNRWLANARPKLPGYEVEVVAVSPGSRYEARIVEEIRNDQDRKFIIAGHSEGASSITRISKQLDALAAQRKINPANIRLLKLEGYAWAPKYIPYECWYGEGRNGKTGFNASKMKKCGASHARRYCNRTCTSEVCLHFSVVNATPPPRLGSGNLSDGYDNLTANVSWVKEGAGLEQCR